MKGHQRRLFGFLEIQPLVTPEVELSHVETREIASHTVCSDVHDERFSDQ